MVNSVLLAKCTACMNYLKYEKGDVHLLNFDKVLYVNYTEGEEE